MPRGRKKGAKVNPTTGAVKQPEKNEEVATEEAVETQEVKEVKREEVVKELKQEPKKTEFPLEFKDRFYYLKKGNPVYYGLKSKRIFWYDPEKGFEREVMFTANQKTPFVDEFEGDVKAVKIGFKDGVLRVPKEKRVWQLILSKLHPKLNKVYTERDEEVVAMDELEKTELRLEAMKLAQTMDIHKAESIVRTSAGSGTSKMSSKEIKRDLYLLAEENPALFIELANDEGIEARNLGIKAVEQGLIRLSGDNRTFYWASNDRKLFDVPFDEHPYSALVSWFKTDEGLEVYSILEKRVV